MVTFILVLCAVAILDILWVFYVDAIKNYKAVSSALLASLVYILGGAAIIAYTSDVVNLIAAFIGAFVGTYFAVIVAKKRSQNRKES